MKKSNALKKLFMFIVVMFLLSGCGSEKEEINSVEQSKTMTVYQMFNPVEEHRMIGIWVVHYFDESTGLSTDCDGYYQFETAEDALNNIETSGEDEGEKKQYETTVVEHGLKGEYIHGKSQGELLEFYEGWKTFEGILEPVDRTGNGAFTVYGTFQSGEREDGMIEIWQVFYFDENAKCERIDAWSVFENEEIAKENYEYYKNDFYEEGEIESLDIQGNMLFAKGVTGGYSMFGETRDNLITVYDGWLMMFEGVVTPFDAVEETAQ